MNSPNSSPDDYFLEIESHFAARRGTPFLFSAKDWALLKEWQTSGIPLPIVLEAIDSCFEKRESAGRKRVISSLSYCRHAVKELWDERRDLQVGAGGGVPERDTAARIAELASLLRQSAASAPATGSGALERAAAAIEALPAGESVPALEERLAALEEQLLNELRTGLAPDDARALAAEVEATLAGHRLDEAVASRTRDANFRRLLRASFRLPRLSLFG